jgi:hypothetical protein
MYTFTVNLPLFLTTLPRTSKSQEIFKMTSLCHIAIMVEVYKAHTGLTQCYNCQIFGHVWANCKQPPRCMLCGGGHLHKECTEEDNAASKPTCRNSSLQLPRLQPGQGWDVKESQRAPNTTSGKVFSSTTPLPDRPSRRRCAATHSSSPIRLRLHRPAPSLWEK